MSHRIYLFQMTPGKLISSPFSRYGFVVQSALVDQNQIARLNRLPLSIHG